MAFGTFTEMALHTSKDVKVVNVCIMNWYWQNIEFMGVHSLAGALKCFVSIRELSFWDESDNFPRSQVFFEYNFFSNVRKYMQNGFIPSKFASICTMKCIKLSITLAILFCKLCAGVQNLITATLSINFVCDKQSTIYLFNLTGAM